MPDITAPTSPWEIRRGSRLGSECALDDSEVLASSAARTVLERLLGHGRAGPPLAASSAPSRGGLVVDVVELGAEPANAFCTLISTLPTLTANARDTVTRFTRREQNRDDEHDDERPGRR